MDSPPKLSGETLIVHHMPLVHCQVSGRQCGGSIKPLTPFTPRMALSLTRAASLPEQEVHHREGLVYSSLIQTSGSDSSSYSGTGLGGGDGDAAGRDRGSLASDYSSSYTSNTSEETPLPPPAPLLKSQERGTALRRNPFLLNAEEEEVDEEGGNLNGYLEDSSFHLHRNSNANFGLDQVAPESSPFHLHDLGYSPKPFLLHDTLGGAWGATGFTGAMDGQERGGIGSSGAHSQLQSLGLSGLESQRHHGSSGSTLSMEWGEEEEEDDDQPVMGGRTCSWCSSSDPVRPTSCSSGLSEPFAEDGLHLHLGYGSDSSCNSSDGVLVNFSAIYNKMNNAVPAYAKPANLNGSVERSCTSTSDEPGGAFYLDLLASPTEPHACLDANCNSYAVPSEGLQDLTSCFQSQVRLVVATQNYYKLVTCDLSSQSSPSPLGASVTSCTEEPRGASPAQPTEYYLFRQQEEEEERSQREEEGGAREEEGGADPTLKVIEGQVYVNVSPAVGSQGAAESGRLRSRSYDRHLDKSPPAQLGYLERMLSCPVRLSEGTAYSSPLAPPRVTSFAEIARSKRRSGDAAAWFAAATAGGSPSLRAGTEVSSSCQSLEISPLSELLQLSHSHSLPPLPFTRCYSQGNRDASPNPQPPGGAHQEARTKAEGGLSSSSTEGRPAVVRYSKDQRPTSLPIQPFTLHQQVGHHPGTLLRPLLTEYVNNMQGRMGQDGARERPPEEQWVRCAPGSAPGPDAAPGSAHIRPSPLGSYSPVCQQEEHRSVTCSACSLSPHPPHSLSCPVTAGLLPVRPSPGGLGHDPEPTLGEAAPPPTPPLTPLLLRKGPPTASVPASCQHCDFALAPEFSPLGHLEPAQHGGREADSGPSCCSGSEQPNAHHLSPQALKWREYRRKNPLGVERAGGGGKSAASLSSSLDGRRAEGRLPHQNVFDFPASSCHAHGQQNGQSAKQQQNYYSDIFPDYFSLTERPPEEFCLSPDASSESLSIDLLQKKALVKAINMAVDLIVAHFGTSRDPGVKAKLGNSSVSPNVGHLILKYLCPAIRDILQDGLRGHVLDLIIGQRRNVPWSVVEASTQLGPSTRVLHGLHSKVSQYSELTSHSMRLNAFIFGLLNLRCLEFWFNHLYMHEDIVAAHYHAWGFLPLAQGACQPLYKELLLLLQPLSLLPIHLDLLFEPDLLQRSQEHLRHKEQLRTAGQGLEQSARSTFQLMRGWGSLGAEPKGEGAGPKKDRAEMRREGSRSRSEGVESRMEGAGQRMDVFGVRSQGPGGEGREAGLGDGEGSRERKKVEIRGDSRREAGAGLAERAKGVGQESGQGQVTGEMVVDWGRDSDNGAKPLDKQAIWWYQLMQSSQVYIDNSSEGSKFVKWEKRKKSASEAAEGRGGATDLGAGHRLSPPPPRVGVVEGAEACQDGAELKEGGKNSSGSNSSSVARGWRSWIGSPPDSVLGEMKKSQETSGEGHSPGLRWSRLFGASVGASLRTEKAEQLCPTKSQKSRLPSGWFSLDRSVMDLMAQTMGVGKRPDSLPPPSQCRAPPPMQQPDTSAAKQHSPWVVRTLCDYDASKPGQLGFRKGDVLRVLSHAQPDWLLCARGERTGLVPIVYVTLAEDPEGSC